MNAANNNSRPVVGCEKCEYSGYIFNENGAAPCECRLKAITYAHLMASKIPPKYMKKTFESFKAGKKEMKENKQAAQEFAENFKPGCRGMMFTGDIGTGKTHLSIAVLKTIIERGYTGYFANVIRLLDNIKATYGTNSKEDEINVMFGPFNSDLLILDDLGAEKTSGWVMEKMYALINHRYEHDKTILVTTNMSFDELGKQISPKTASRLREMCIKAPFKGKDYRKEALETSK